MAIPTFFTTNKKSKHNAYPNPEAIPPPPILHAPLGSGGVGGGGGMGTYSHQSTRRHRSDSLHNPAIEHDYAYGLAASPAHDNRYPPAAAIQLGNPTARGRSYERDDLNPNLRQAALRRHAMEEAYNDDTYTPTPEERARHHATMRRIDQWRRASQSTDDPYQAEEVMEDQPQRTITVTYRNLAGRQTQSSGSSPHRASNHTHRNPLHESTTAGSPHHTHSKSRSRSTSFLLDPGAPVTAENAHTLYPTAIQSVDPSNYCRRCHAVPPSRTQCLHGVYNPH